MESLFSLVSADLNGSRVTGNGASYRQLFAFYITASRFCPVHFSLFAMLNIGKGWPQATEHVYLCTALVLMSKERAGVIKD